MPAIPCRDNHRVDVFSIKQLAHVAICFAGRIAVELVDQLLSSLATTRLDVNGVVRKTLGRKKASFASADETAELTGMQIGGVTPYGLPVDLPLWIDAKVMDVERVIVGGGSRDRKLLVPPASLRALPNATVVDELARAADAS